MVCATEMASSAVESVKSSVADLKDKAGDIAGPAEDKAAGRCAHLAFQPLPAPKEPIGSKPLETGKELVSHLEPGGAHVHQARPREIGQRPQSADQENNAGFPRVVGAGGCNWLAGFVTKQDPALPVVKVGEPEAVGELQNWDDLHASTLSVKPSLPWPAVGFKTVSHIVGLEVIKANFPRELS